MIARRGGRATRRAGEGQAVPGPDAPNRSGAPHLGDRRTISEIAAPSPRSARDLRDESTVIDDGRAITEMGGRSPRWAPDLRDGPPISEMARFAAVCPPPHVRGGGRSAPIGYHPPVPPWTAAGALLAALSVAAGAFGAHALAARLDVRSLALWETAARYLMYSGLGLALLGLFARQAPPPPPSAPPAGASSPAPSSSAAPSSPSPSAARVSSAPSPPSAARC